MLILVINAGSTSAKYQLVDMTNEKVLAKGGAERIGGASFIKHVAGENEPETIDIKLKNNNEAFAAIVNLLTTGQHKVIDSIEQISAVGHRVSFGPIDWNYGKLATKQNIEILLDHSEFAPLHVPMQVAALKASQEVFGENFPMCVVFDNSFHHTMPEKAYIYGIPYEYYEKYGIRKFGFHSISHEYVSERYFDITKKEKNGSKLVTCHLGGGSSVCAIMDGKSLDNSMGFTPVDGIIMGTRSGSVDPAIVSFIAKKEGIAAEQVTDILNQKSGLLGVSGISSDCRDVEDAMHTNKRARLAVDIMCYQLTKLIGSYAAAMGGVDSVIFTGGIGEKFSYLRYEALKNLSFIGLEIDAELNKQANGKDGGRFSKDSSKVSAYVIPTNEEIMIARQTKEIILKGES